MFDCNNCSFLWACNSNIGYCPKRMVEKEILELDERTQFIVNMHCGFLDGKKHSFAEIGRQLYLSGTRIEQVFKKAIYRRKMLLYLGVSDSIVSYGMNNSSYATFFAAKFSENDKTLFEQVIINDIALPKHLLDSSKAEYNELTNLHIEKSCFSTALKNKLSQKNVATLGDILSLPFSRVFFDLLDFDLDLYKDLVSIVTIILNLEECFPLDSPVRYYGLEYGFENNLKESIKKRINRYVFNYNRFFEHEQDLSKLLPFLAEKKKYADLLSECFYTDSIDKLTTYGFDFVSYWQSTYKHGFFSEDLLNTIRQNPFPASVTEIANAFVADDIKKLDIDFCNFSILAWQKLRRMGITTIGDLCNPEATFYFHGLLPREHVEMFTKRDEINNILAQIE